MSYEFDNLWPDLLRDIFVCGLSKYSNIKERLLSENKLTLDKVVQITKNMIIAHENGNKLQAELPEPINAIQNNSNKDNKMCFK